ncbi:hypothetical protein ACE60T_001802 [Salmonella enterica]
MMKNKALLLVFSLMLVACGEPEGKQVFMQECTAQGNTALCECAWKKLSQRYGPDWGKNFRLFASSDFIAFTAQAADECMAD